MKYKLGQFADLKQEERDWIRQQQAYQLLIMAGHIANDARIAFSETAVGILGAAQTYWKLLQDDLKDIPKSDAASAFFNNVCPQVQLTLQRADTKLPERELINVKQFTGSIN
jgi:hypothetical protein